MYMSGRNMFFSHIQTKKLPAAEVARLFLIVKASPIWEKTWKLVSNLATLACCNFTSQRLSIARVTHLISDGARSYTKLYLIPDPGYN